MNRSFERLFEKTAVKRKPLTLEKLKVLVELSSKGSFAAMAPGQRSRQSSYSHQISDLNEFFGGRTRLVEKGVITDHGRKLADLVREHFLALESFLDESGREKSSFRFAANGSILSWVLIPKLVPLMRERPDLKFAFEDVRTEAARKALADGSVDFALIRSSADSLKRMETTRILEYGYKQYFPKDMERKSWKSLPLALSTGGEFRSRLNDLFPETLVPSYELQNNAECAALVRMGLATAILPDLADETLKDCPSQTPKWLASYRRTIIVARRKETKGQNVAAILRALGSKP